MNKEVKYAIRNVQGDDVQHIARIISECFWPTTPRQIKEWLRRDERESKGATKTFVAVVDGKVVSQVVVEFINVNVGEGVYVKTGGIAGVCTDSDYRKRGIVTNLMKHALEYAKQKGASNSSLYTGCCIPAHRVYSRLGFLDIERWPMYIKLIDFSYVFSTWLREWNKLLKHSKLAAKALQHWNKTVVLEISEYGRFAFRCRNRRFYRLKTPPKKPNVILSVAIKTLLEVMADLSWEDAMNSGRLEIKQGSVSDIAIVKKLLPWAWSE